MEMIGQRRREMMTMAMGLNKSDLLSRFMGSIEDDKYLRDIVISFLRTILSSVRIDGTKDLSD
ncbi:hypothetical protein AHAS_Ahas02G0052100 [Arachis hypogaea]